MYRNKLLGVALLAGLSAACTPARIAVPPFLAATAQPLKLTGMGFGERGTFALGNSTGHFDRRAFNSEVVIPWSDEGIRRSFGGGRLSVQGGDFAGVVEAQCRYREQEVGSDRLSITTSPFHYRCRFLRDGAPIPADVVLHAAPRTFGPLTGETRAGIMTIRNRAIAIEPIHHSPGLAVPTGEPLGYRFVAEGRDIGAVDINGATKTIYAPAAGEEREAVLLGSLALSLLWGV